MIAIMMSVMIVNFAMAVNISNLSVVLRMGRKCEI